MSFKDDGLVRIQVKVEMFGERAVKVSVGKRSAWIPYIAIDDESEVHEKTPVGITAMLVIADQVAESLGLC